MAKRNRSTLSLKDPFFNPGERDDNKCSSSSGEEVPASQHHRNKKTVTKIYHDTTREEDHGERHNHYHRNHHSKKMRHSPATSSEEAKSSASSSSSSEEDTTSDSSEGVSVKDYPTKSNNTFLGKESKSNNTACTIASTLSEQQAPTEIYRTPLTEEKKIKKKDVRGVEIKSDELNFTGELKIKNATEIHKTSSNTGHKGETEKEILTSSAKSLPLPMNSALGTDHSHLMAEIICRIADFTADLGVYIASQTGYEWKPKLLQESNTAAERRKIKKVKDPNEPRRPLSGYNLWCDYMRKKYKEDQPDKPLKLTDLAEMWKNLADKSVWEQVAKEKRDDYYQQLEAYRNGQASTPVANTSPRRSFISNL